MLKFNQASAIVLLLALCLAQSLPVTEIRGELQQYNKDNLKNEVQYLPHETDCQLFYVAVGDEVIVSDCAEDELFDEETMSCQESESVSCGRRDRRDRNKWEKKYRGGDSSSSESKEVKDKDAAAYCHWKRDGDHAHSEYCHMFYSCSKKSKKLHTCPKGKLFDVYRHKCEPREKVNCNGRKDPDVNPPGGNFQCPSSRESYHPHAKDCGKYYHCEKRKSKLKSCKKGHLFDINRNKCRDEEDVDCGNRTHPSDNPDEDQDKIVDHKPNYRCRNRHGRFEHKDYCDWYFHCKDRRPSVRECRKGYLYDITKRECREYKKVVCHKRIKPEHRKKTTTLEPTTVTTKYPTSQQPEKTTNTHEKSTPVSTDAPKETTTAPQSTTLSSETVPPVSQTTLSPETQPPVSETVMPSETPVRDTTLSPHTDLPVSETTLSPETEAPVSETTLSPETEPPVSETTLSPDTEPPVSETTLSPETEPPVSETTLSPETEAPVSETTLSPETEPPVSETTLSPETEPPVSETTLSPETEPPVSETTHSPETEPPVSETTSSEPETTESSENPQPGTSDAPDSSSVQTTADGGITSTLKPFECEENGHYPYPNDCALYYVCVNKMSILAKCPAGTLFDTVNKRCDHIDVVDCGDRGRPTEETVKPTISSTEKEDTTTESTTEPTTTTTTEPTTTARPTGPPETNCPKDDLDCILDQTGDVSAWFDCKEDNGNHVHPSSPNLFIHCINGKPHARRCATGLEFDPDLLVCTIPFDSPRQR